MTDRVGKIKLESSVMLEDGANSIQVRMIFCDPHKRLTPNDWSAWSAPLDPPPIGPSTVSMRQDRLIEYLNPSLPPEEQPKEKEKQANSSPAAIYQPYVRQAY